MKHASPLYVTAALWEVLRLGLLYFAVAGTALIQSAGNTSSYVLALGAPQLVLAAMWLMIFVDRERYEVLHAPLMSAKVLSVVSLIYLITISRGAPELPGVPPLLSQFRILAPYIVGMIDLSALAALSYRAFTRRPQSGGESA